MKLNHRQKYRLLWVGVGLGAVLLVSAMILMQITSFRKHIPLSYGTEPYSQNPVSDEVCQN
jgi:hypothetical protein